MKYFFRTVNHKRVCCHCGYELGSGHYYNSHRREAFKRRAEIMEELSKLPNNDERPQAVSSASHPNPSYICP